MTLPSSQDFRLTSVLMSLYSVKDHSARHSADERYTLQKTKNKNKNKTKTKQKSQKKPKHNYRINRKRPANDYFR